MQYIKTENNKIISVMETTDAELAEINGYVLSEKEVVQIHNGSYKFADDVTEDDFKPTQKELDAEEISRLKVELASTDYKCLKYVDGALSAEEYAEVREYRAELRQRINELERT